MQAVRGESTRQARRNRVPHTRNRLLAAVRVDEDVDAPGADESCTRDAVARTSSCSKTRLCIRAFPSTSIGTTHGRRIAV